MIRLRLQYTKLGKIRFLSHRDIARVWERTIRRVGLPIAYSEGFSPRPRLHFGLALSVAHESEAEYLDIDLREPVELGGLAEDLSSILPDGMDVVAVSEIPRSAESLQGEVDLVTWSFLLPDVTVGELSARVAEWLARDTVVVSIIRKGKSTTADVRAVVEELTVGPGTADGAELVAVLSTRPRSIRPAELLASFDPPLSEGRVRRLAQTILTDGVGRPPLPIPTVPIPTSNPEPAVREAV
jgi:radical SAM-linked protein